MNVRRLLVAVGAPLILVVGLGVAWGVRKGSAMIEQIDAWSDSLQHSAQPVTMNVSGIPVVSNLHIGGEPVGKLSQVVVLRDAPGAVDSLRFVVDGVDESMVGAFDDCQLYIDPDVFETIEGPGVMKVLKRVVTCDNHAENLVPFGSMIFTDMDREAPLFIQRRHHPCDNWDGSGECLQLKDEFRAEMNHLRELRDEIRREVRENVRQNVRVNVRQNVRVNVP